MRGARGDWRSSVLGSLYGLVECTSPKILLAVARVVLAVSACDDVTFEYRSTRHTFIRFQLCVTGSNLTGACKLVFKVARNERNDSLFVNSDVPGTMHSSFNCYFFVRVLIYFPFFSCRIID